MSEPLIVFARLVSKPGRADTVGEVLRRLVTATQAEPGSLSYLLHRDIEDPNVWILYETWRSRDDLAAHFAQPHMRDLVARAPDLLERDVELTLAKQVTGYGD